MALGNTVDVRIGATLAPSFSDAFFNAERTADRLGAAVTRMDRDLRNVRGFRELQHEVGRASQTFQEAQRDLANLERRVESGERQTDELVDAWVDAEQRVESARGELDALGREMEEARRSTDQFDRSTEGLGRTQSNLERQLEQTRRAQARYNTTMEEANRLKTKSRNLGMAAAGTAAVAYGMGRAIAAPIRVGLDFEQATADVTAIAQDPGSFGNLEEAHKALEERMMSLGKDTAFKAEEVAAAAKYLSVAGFNVSETVAALPATLDLAIAGDMDVGATADIMSNIMQPFNIQAEESARVADVMAQAITTANTDIRQLGDAMKYVAPVANEAGMSMEQTTAAIAMLSNSGIQASKAGTALRAMLNRLADPKGDGGKIIAKLGVEVQDESGDMRNPFDVMREMSEQMEEDGLGSRERLANLSKVFGQQAMAGASILMREAEERGEDVSSALNDYIDSLYSVSSAEGSGVASRMAEKRLDTLSGDWEKFTGAVDEAFNKMYKGVKPVLRGVAQWLGRATDGVIAWMDAHPGLTKALTITAVAVTGLTASAAVFLGVASAVYAVKWMWVKANAALGLSVGATATKVGMWSLITAKANLVATAASTRMKSLAAWYTVTNATLLTTINRVRVATAAWVAQNLTVTALAAKMRALGAATAVYAATGVGKIKGVGVAIAASATNALTAIRGLTAAKVVSGLGAGMRGIGAALLIPIGGLKALAAAAWGFVVSNPLGWIIGAVAAVGFAVYKYWEPIKAFASGVWESVSEAFKPVVTQLKPVAELFGHIGSAVSTVIGAFLDLVAPVDASTESLDRAQQMGRTVGRVIGLIAKPFEVIAWVIGQTAEMINWVIERLDVLADKFGWVSKIGDALSTATNAMTGGFLGETIQERGRRRDQEEEEAERRAERQWSDGTVRRRPINNVINIEDFRPPNHVEQRESLPTKLVAESTKPVAEKPLIFRPKETVEKETQIERETKETRETTETQAPPTDEGTVRGYETPTTHVNVPETRPPNVNVAAPAAQAAPSNVINMPRQESPNVNVDAQASTPTVNVAQPPQEQVRPAAPVVDLASVRDKLEEVGTRITDAITATAMLANSLPQRTTRIDQILIEVNGAESPRETADAIIARYNEEMLMVERELVD